MNIYRYRLPVIENKIQEIAIPSIFNILDVQPSCKSEIISIWAAVNPKEKDTKLRFILLRTGAEIPKFCTYLKTLNIDSKIYHLFQLNF